MSTMESYAGVRKLSERVTKEGRSFVITSDNIPWKDIPVGAIKVVGTTIYTKMQGGTTWQPIAGSAYMENKDPRYVLGFKYDGTHFITYVNNSVYSIHGNSLKNQLIKANSSKTFTRANNLDKSPITVLVKDPDSSSRTYGKYINSEGVATIAYDTNSYTIYNDTSTDLYFTILSDMIS